MRTTKTLLMLIVNLAACSSLAQGLVSAKSPTKNGTVKSLNTSAKQDGVKGGMNSGGGDIFTLDFISIAQNEVYPWLKANPKALSRYVDPEAFLKAADPSRVASLDAVYENCEQPFTGREVQACYNGQTDQIFLSRSLYPLNAGRDVRSGVVAHEIFRRMGLEGDGYELSRNVRMKPTVNKKATLVNRIETYTVAIKDLMTSQSCYKNFTIDGTGRAYCKIPFVMDAYIQAVTTATYWGPKDLKFEISGGKLFCEGGLVNGTAYNAVGFWAVTGENHTPWDTSVSTADDYNECFNKVLSKYLERAKKLTFIKSAYE